jgi:hypothetical protein
MRRREAEEDIDRSTTMDIEYLIKVIGSEENHIFAREGQKAYSIVPPGNMHVPIWRSDGR